MKFLKNWAKPISHLTCLVVLGIVMFFKNFLIFSASGDIPSFVIELTRNFIDCEAISHLSGDNFSPDLRMIKFCYCTPNIVHELCAYTGC